MKRFFPYLRYLRPVRWHFRGGVLAGLIYGAASGAGLPLMFNLVLPVVFGEEPKEATQWYKEWAQDFLGSVDPDRLLLFSCLWIPFIFLVRGISGFLNAYWIQYCGYRVLEQIREELFAKLQSLPLAFFHQNKSGDLLARMTQDTEMVRQVVAQVSSDLIKQPAMLIFSVGALTWMSMQDKGAFVLVIALLSVPVIIIPLRLMGMKLLRRAKQLQRSQGDLSSALTESLQSPLEVRAYNLQEDQQEKFSLRIRELLRLSMKVMKYQKGISPIVEFVAAIGFAIALYFGVREGLTLSTFIALGTALYMAYEPVKKLGAVHMLLSQGTASIDRIEEVLKAENPLTEPETPKKLGQVRGKVEMAGVSFAYGEEQVLKDVTLRVPPGQCVALVGPSGGGKTTFANLIPRFYDATAGTVLVDGTDVRDLGTRELRDAIAVVPQMPVLFFGTIKENILVGKKEASDEEVEQAARCAYAHEFILNLENGYDTVVSEKGTSLSGGQRQRIALARAFLKNAPILILDEATSALDNESEAKVQAALQELIKGKTTFIIAHRMSTVRIAERILVFDRGRIVEDGPAEELMSRGGAFAELAG